MTKAELVEKMAKDAGISKVAAKAALKSFLDGIKKGLKKKNSRACNPYRLVAAVITVNS